jgi:phosphatidylserine decarboxylase
VIQYWSRETKKLETEKVYGDAMVQLLYGSRAGQLAANSLLSRRFFSQAYGALQSSTWSKRKIEPFIRHFNIDMTEYEKADFKTFNEFFIRKFKPGARPSVSDPSQMSAFSEARYFGYESISPDQKIPVKGEFLSAEALLADQTLAERFEHGPLLLARLCPVDYHRFHFPDDGQYETHYRVAGRLHSVNPLALRFRGDIFATNERQVSILVTKNFGTLAYIEVGALCVGLIVQTHPTQGAFKKGAEKGYFLFGASTVIVLGEKGKWKPSADILEQTHEGRETLVRLGSEVAVRR